MMRALRLAAMVAAVVFVSGQAEGAWLDGCTRARLLASWKHDGFWRSSRVDMHKIEHVGEVHAAGRKYGVYYDENVNPETQHGHHDLVVTTPRGRFLGFYDLSGSQGKARVQGADVLFNSSKEFGNRIHFGRKGPPHQAYVDGENPDFNTPEELAKHTAPGAKLPPEPKVRVSAYCRHH